MEHLWCGRLHLAWPTNVATIPVGANDTTSLGFAKSAVRLRRSSSFSLQLAVDPTACCDTLRQRNMPFRAALRHRRRWLRHRHRRYLHERLVSEFWGGARGESPLLRLLRVLRNRGIVGVAGIGEGLRSDNVSPKSSLPRNAAGVIRPIFFDVGAAAYEGPDVSHALAFARLWRCYDIAFGIGRPLVLALEPLPEQLQNTRMLVEQHLARENVCTGARSCEIRWLQLAASNVSGRLVRMSGHRNQATISPHIPLHTSSLDYAALEPNAISTEARTVRLDDLVLEQGLATERIALVKLDTEGHDWEAMLGAAMLLESQRIDALVFELAGQMNADFFLIHKEQHRERAAERLMRLQMGAGTPLAEPNLRSIVVWLELRGYACMLLGQRSLVPLSGDWWSAELELCVVRPDVPCWYDVLALRSSDAASLRHLFASWLM